MHSWRRSCTSATCWAGFSNHELVLLVASLWDQPYSSRQATYDLRRLRRKGLITRVPGSHCYQLTRLGRRVAVLSPRHTAGSWLQVSPCLTVSVSPRGYAVGAGAGYQAAETHL